MKIPSSLTCGSATGVHSQALALPASSSSLWLWLGSHEPLDPPALTDALDDGAVRLAVGGAGFDLDGFRRSHFEAVSAQ